MTTPAVLLEDVCLWRTAEGRRRSILAGIDLAVRPGEHWAVLGPNGCGKTTLVRVVSAQVRPSSGSVTVLGGRFGRTSLPALRRRIGCVEPGVARRAYPTQTVFDVVLSGALGSVLFAEEIDPPTIERARGLLERVGLAALETSLFSTCSEGERARALLARALVPAADLLVLDEPTAGLDLPGRELFLSSFEELVRERPSVPTVLVSHHLEDLPRSTTHALLLREGRVVAAGKIDEAITAESLGRCFGLELRVDVHDGRRYARLA